MKKKILTALISLALVIGAAGAAYGAWGTYTYVSNRGCFTAWHDVYLHLKVAYATTTKFAFDLGRALADGGPSDAEGVLYTGTLGIGSTIIFDTNLNDILTRQGGLTSVVRPYGPNGTPKLLLIDWECK